MQNLTQSQENLLKAQAKMMEAMQCLLPGVHSHDNALYGAIVEAMILSGQLLDDSGYEEIEINPFFKGRQ